MRIEATSLIAILISATTILQTIHSNRPYPRDLIDDACNTDDTEALIACGKKVSLSTATQADLEMIPGISPRMAIDIVRLKDELLYTSTQLHPDLRYVTLTKIKGVSFKKAYEIGLYLKVF